ncbi:MAG: 4Fe-4S binding protein, partial [Pseudodesulfovibrio sp.]
MPQPVPAGKAAADRRGSMFADKDKCKRCGACAAECPYDLIVDDAEGFPKLRPAARKTCIACGHCVAVCPTGAL